jgi:transposase
MHCIGVDVGKQELVTYDGEKERIFPNDPKLSQFRRFIKATTDPLIVFEPTSTYSRRLETFCRTEKIACCQLNPRGATGLGLAITHTS